MKNNTFKIYTLGCKVNQYDSNYIQKILIKKGFILNDNDSSLAIINTCAVTKKAIKKCRNLIKKARKENPNAKIIITGCWPKIYKKEVIALNPDIITENSKLIKKFNNFIVSKNKNNLKNNCQNKNIKNKLDRSRYFIKIQDGCEQFCSYCIIPYTRGKLKSSDMEDVISEIKLAVNNGFKEIVLCGIHLGLYGVDKNSKKLLVPFIKELLKINNLERIRLSSIEISEIDEELINLMYKNNKICRHLHIPLQSGCNKILKLMNRPYNLAYFKNKILRIKKIIPEISITTDIIVGFPGETKKDFNDTLKFIKYIKFSKLHIFPFSEHEKTIASKMINKVSDKDKKKRVEILLKLSKVIENRYKKKFIGKKLNVVIEKRGKNYIGKTSYYFDVKLDSNNKYKKKDIINVKIKLPNII